MYRAFDMFPIVEVSTSRMVGEVTAIAGHGASVLVGTSKGHIYIYDVKHSTETKIIESRLADEGINVSYWGITQIEVYPELGLILTLAGGLVYIHSLHTLSPIGHVKKSKGAVLFTCQCRAQSTEKLHTPINNEERKWDLSMVCVIRRKLVIFQWDGKQFVDIKSIDVQHTANRIGWCSSYLCVSFKRECVIVDIERGETRVLYATESNQETIIKCIEDREFMLTKGHTSFFIGHDGRATRHFTIDWTEIPLAIETVSDYGLSLLPLSIELRSLQTTSLIQTIPVKGAVILASAKTTTETNIDSEVNGGSVLTYVADKYNVWTLVSLPLDRQIENAIAANEIQEALHLTERLEEGPNKVERFANLKHLNAEHLLKEHKFEEAMLQFTENQADPKMVVSYFPDLLPPDVRAAAKYSRIIANLEGEDLRNSVFALISFLSTRRDRLDRAEQEGAVVTNEITDTRMVIDTYLLKCFVMVSPHTLKKLLKRPNHCNLLESERCLLENKFYKDLLALYEYKGLHRKALTLLKEQSMDSNSELYGVEYSVLYMQNLLPNHLDLVVEFSQWILQSYPEEGLQIFTGFDLTNGDKPKGTDSYTRIYDVILTHMENLSPVLAKRYLEYIIVELGNTSAQFHNKLIMAYVQGYMPLRMEYLATLGDSQPCEGGCEPGELGIMRGKLLDYLTSLRYFNAALLLGNPVFNDLLEEKALLLGRMGQHSQALSLYAYQLGNIPLAWKYCDRVFHMNDQYSEGIYLTLLQVYMTPSEGAEPMLQAAIQLLVEYGDKINAIKALELLPPDTLLTPLFPYLEAIIQSTTKRRRQNQILKNLHKAENLQLQNQLNIYHQYNILVTNDSLCDMCGKKIGTSAIAISLTGANVHFACMPDATYDINHHTT